MLIRNKHESQEIGVTNKFNEVIILKPGEQIEVEDAQGKGYLANYANIFEKLDIDTVENGDKDSQILTLTKQVLTLTKLVERLTSGKVDELEADEKALIQNAELVAGDEEAEKVALIAELKTA